MPIQDEHGYVGEAIVSFEGNKLIVEFGDGRNAVLELADDEERELIKTVLADINLWANFLNALSAAIGKHK